ncbi:MAG TPA: hypothetical protein VK745_10795 [Polyangiaceae bacterium]|jgi:hypothetical protein|nr:hypothetical protein [Polyangiaceae bacterium]
MTDTKHKGGRPRKGSLELRGKTWHARLTVTVEGESVRKWIDLKTDNKISEPREPGVDRSRPNSYRRSELDQLVSR